MIAILSSVALKKGYLPLRMLKNMIPVLQMSTAFNFQNDYHWNSYLKFLRKNKPGVWWVDLNKTSGALEKKQHS